MAEAEDVITDVARHATVFAQELWRRHRPQRESLDVSALLHRVDLFISAAFGQSFPLRVAQPPAPRTFVRRLFRRYEEPVTRLAVPATDGQSLWLPMPAADMDEAAAAEGLRIMALQQAARAIRGAPQVLLENDAWVRVVWETLEADAADVLLANRLPGLATALKEHRRRCLELRPPLDAFPVARRPLEAWVRELMDIPLASGTSEASAQQTAARAASIAAQLRQAANAAPAVATLLYRDAWTGELRQPERDATPVGSSDLVDDVPAASRRSARLTRRPKVREVDERDRRDGASAWMVQTESAHEHAEDPFGMQRPVDRDEDTPADNFADSLSELPEARLVSTSGAQRQVLVSDNPPPARWRDAADRREAGTAFNYPEWNFRQSAYRMPGATVQVLEPALGSAEWVQRTLDTRRALLQVVRRQFESLRAQRALLRQQSDGDELDLEACIDAFADAQASGTLAPGLYCQARQMRRELAVLLLVDISGSTDSWIAQQRRVIDVEREALLLVCIALESLGEPYSVMAFSGEGASCVTVRSIKRFAERYGDGVARRIAGLGPERYTRAGAAIRHASALLMQQPVRHRLLLVLSDGKPSDRDEYDGRYGVEDMRQAVVEAKLQGIFPFCLTIDRLTASYLPGVFGAGQYCVLHSPERLPTALLRWLRQLVR